MLVTLGHIPDLNTVGPNMTTEEISAVELYWRPGCGFCARLERNLEPTGIPIDRFNIWENDEHAAFVRSVANGNETVPTVRIGEISMVNPSAKEILQVLQRDAPHLLPEGTEVPEAGKVNKLLGKLLGG